MRYEILDKESGLEYIFEFESSGSPISLFVITPFMSFKFEDSDFEFLHTAISCNLGDGVNSVSFYFSPETSNIMMDMWDKEEKKALSFASQI
jgi:hypothetical protein